MDMELDRDRRETERRFLESIRPQYEAKGYSFQLNPSRDELPSFLGSYVPDAIATKGDSKFAIEVKVGPNSATSQSLQKIRELFEGQSEWKFVVAYSGADVSQISRLPIADRTSIIEKLEDARALSISGHARAAFLVAWSLLEAALNVVKPEADKRPRTPGTVVEGLTMDGFISYETEALLRPLIERRNRVVHGDLSIEPSQSDVEIVLDAVKSTLEDA